VKLFEYTTSTGITVGLKPIAPNYIERIRQQIDWPEPPSYEVPVLGGGTERVYYTDKNVETDEEKAAWAEFEQKRDAANILFFQKRSQAIIRRCVVIDLPEDDSWERLQEQDGIEIPQDPELKRIHYIETEVIGSNTDVFAIANIAERLARFDEEDYAQAMAFFRDRIQRDSAE